MASDTTPDPLAEAKADAAWLYEIMLERNADAKVWDDILCGDYDDTLFRIAARHEAMAEALGQGVRLIRALEETGK